MWHGCKQYFVFSEFNQPTVHTKDAVELCLEAIHECNWKIDAKKFEDENEKVQIKVKIGTNIGGSFVAGVFELERPTFALIGKTIGIAQEITKTAQPMKIEKQQSSSIQKHTLIFIC